MSEMATMVKESLMSAESGWSDGIGVNTSTERAKDGITRLACVILKHKLDVVRDEKRSGNPR